MSFLFAVRKYVRIHIHSMKNTTHTKLLQCAPVESIQLYTEPNKKQRRLWEIPQFQQNPTKSKASFEQNTQNNSIQLAGNYRD